MTRQAAVAIALPAGFRPGDILAFHRRDTQELAERVTGDSLCKGLLWDGIPACLNVRFADGVASAEIVLDAEPARDLEPRFGTMVRRMLGLDQTVEAFEERFRDDPGIGSLISAQKGLRVPVTTTPFEALSWAVTGQQICVAAAVSLRRRLIVAAGIRHRSGMLCYPDAGGLAHLAEDDLRAAGFSTAKARTLLTLARRVGVGELPLDAWAETASIEEIRSRLLAVRGVGPWTVDYVLLRGFGWLDGSLHGDVAVRRGLQALQGTEGRVGEAEAKEWLARYAPWRALVAAHLWAAGKAAAY
ncbi:DNA-3-methyladenine glycosylase family protein [Aromatoleum petrolei]|uniref:DNA-3-methyladenine glycosylase II n=1 Tax=Aromatoleum petrolei TaxID=76116 RepID=A0ABX1MI33_9RHOO|nr:DNA-3-methyladenine glycosylase 2 [Aromatoleum petrolei]NMF87602.1 3-methyladenine DNA glycosylase 2 [Aromatoleum petrolei]QTQ38701.1 putative DNA-3-methyladenine glycosylase [Aromatoleum petrolei]